jgi:hypothetical protein
MVPGNKKQELAVLPGLGSIGTHMNRRVFIGGLCAASMTGLVGGAESIIPANCYFTIVNHWHQTGVGWYFREGFVGKKHYKQAFSTFYGVQKTIDMIRQFPWLTICLEFDSHAFEAIQDEDPDFVQNIFRPLVLSGQIDIIGATYSQPYESLVGWQSNVRQFIEGRAIVREVLGKSVDSFLAEEISFHPQMPQLLRLCGFKNASLNVQNNGSLPLVKKAVINWEGTDGSTIPAIPYNPWNISLDKQYQSLAETANSAAESERALLAIWDEVWPPGIDWGSSYLPYAEGIQSLRNKGLSSLGFSEYMSRRCGPGVDLELHRFKLDDGTFLFGWPQNKGMLWAEIGGWGYEGDGLFKENRRLENELHATELMLSLLPDPDRSKRLRSYWKKLMLTQQHDCFMAAGYPAEYEGTLTTNFEVARMMAREVDSGARQLRQEVAERMANKQAGAPQAQVTYVNPAGVPVRQPVVLEVEAGDSVGYLLEHRGEKVELQRLEPECVNDNPRFVGIVDLPPCGVKTYELKRSSAPPAVPSRQTEEIENEYYSIKWDNSSKAFIILDKSRGRSVLFRPFKGEITQINETFWASPNVNAKFRAKSFDEISYSSAVEAGPTRSALAVRGSILTQTQTEEPAAWVTARALLHKELPKVDIIAELHTYPRMRFLALAECEFGPGETKVVRDFPFGEEESHNEQFSALNYVRLQSSDFALLLAHGGTQQFFRERHGGQFLLRNMIGREVLKGSYRWSWSVTTGSSFTAAESYRFAEESRGPIIQRGSGLPISSRSMVSVNDPAIVIFRLAADSKRLNVWLINYGDESKRGELTFTAPLQTCGRVDFEGKPLKELPAVLDETKKRIRLNLSPWEMAALDVELG